MHTVREHVGAVVRQVHEDERGLNTAELLGNAALAIAALLVIWGALEALGVSVVDWIASQLGIG